MKVERIFALPQSEPAGLTSQRLLQRPVPGGTVFLVCEGIDGEEIRATLNGSTLRLTIASGMLRDLKPGDSLLMRVIATDPLLELQPYGTVRSSASKAEFGSQPAAFDLGSQNAMRLDQAAFSRMSWQAPDGELLANMWLTMAVERWDNDQTPRPRDFSYTLALPAPAPGPGVIAESARAWRPPGLERVCFPVYFLDVAPMILGVSDSDDERSSGSGRRRPLVVWIEICAGDMGRVVLQAQAAGDAVYLTIAVEQPGSAQLVRSAVPAIAAALARSGIRLARCRLLKGATSLWRLTAAPVAISRPMLSGEVLSLRLFRALAEAAVVISATATAAVSAPNPAIR